MKKRSFKIKWKNVIFLLLFLFFFILFAVSIYNIIKWKSDSNKIDRQIDAINEIVEIQELPDNNNTEIVEQEERIIEYNPYWDYIQMPLISVDFDELKNINKATVGWIQVNGTNINYPFVQTTDNKYYLTHSFDKSYNSAGWIFLDYRNSINDFDKNTILYAHGRLDTTMFGSLKNIVKSNWYSNSDNYVIKLSTEYENTLWQVFSVYHIENTNDYLKINFNSDADFVNFANKLQTRSIYKFDAAVNVNDKILTLSTCYNKNEKVVMHAKLIKVEKR